VGRVIDPNGNPVAGAMVTIVMVPIAGSSSPTGTTLPDGTFSIPGVPTSQGDIEAQVEVTVVGAFGLSGTSAVVAPVPDGVTDFGDITVRNSCNCGEAVCEPLVGADYSFFTGPDCTGEELYDTFYFGYGGIRRSWDGKGCAGTIVLTMAIRSVKHFSVGCFSFSFGPVFGWVRIYR